MMFVAVLTLETVEKNSLCVTIHLRPIEQKCCLVWFMLYKLVLTQFKSVNKSFVCERSVQNYCEVHVLSCGGHFVI